MDLAYDHIAEQTYGERTPTPTPAKQASSSQPSESTADGTSTNANITPQPRSNLQTEFQETFKAFSNSAWGTKLGGFWASARKQGENYYVEAKKEAEELGSDALKGIEGLRDKVVSVGVGSKPTSQALEDGSSKEIVEGKNDGAAQVDDVSDTTLQDNETFLVRFKSEAAKRLKDVQKAEDAADEALLRFGANIRSFLRDAVAVTAPDASSGSQAEVLFESKDATTGKRVIHTSRFDAQLHVIHSNLSSFTQDPSGDSGQWAQFTSEFDIDKKTNAIAKDLEKYSELRAAMEKLVPEEVEYKDFWARYYFLRHVVEAQEEKRREMLKASANTNDEEEVGWDEDSDSESEGTEKKSTSRSSERTAHHKRENSVSTLQQPPVPTISTTEADTETLRPTEARRSHDEKSVADSDASYDLVSGATSRAPGSPRPSGAKAEESDEEDWE